MAAASLFFHALGDTEVALTRVAVFDLRAGSATTARRDRIVHFLGGALRMLLVLPESIVRPTRALLIAPMRAVGYLVGDLHVHIVLRTLGAIVALGICVPMMLVAAALWPVQLVGQALSLLAMVLDWLIHRFASAEARRAFGTAQREEWQARVQAAREIEEYVTPS